MTDYDEDYPTPGRYDQPESQLIVLNYLNLQGIPVPRAARRRWRRQAHRRELNSQLEWIATDGAADGASTPRAPSPIAPSRTDESIEPRRMAAVERVWELEHRPDAPSTQPTDWDVAGPSFDDLGATADFASLLLDVFSRVKPVDDNQLTAVHTQLVTKALVAVLELTKHVRRLDAAAGRADDGMRPLPLPDDPALSVNAACVVCYAAVADRLLMPCRHLALCAVCICVPGPAC